MKAVRAKENQGPLTEEQGGWTHLPKIKTFKFIIIATNVIQTHGAADRGQT